MMQRDDYLGIGDTDDEETKQSSFNASDRAAAERRILSSSMDVYEALNTVAFSRPSSMDFGLSPQNSRSVLSRGAEFFSVGGIGGSAPPLRSPSQAQRLHHGGLSSIDPSKYQQTPGMPRSAASFNDAHSMVPTNTAPVHQQFDRMDPSSSIRRLDPSMSLLLKVSGQGVEKRRAQSELDMNLPFPVKLHYILSNPKYQDCVAWLPHGRAWRILKPKTFEKTVIPKFFRSATYASFMRQVRCYRFFRLFV